MSAITVSAKGQVTLQKELLRHLGIHPGDKISVEKLSWGRGQTSGSSTRWENRCVLWLPNTGGQKPVSIDEMNVAIPIAKGWTRGRCRNGCGSINREPHESDQ